MASSNFLNNLESYQKDLGVRIFKLLVGRVFNRAYSNLDDSGRESMDKVFDGSDDKAKEAFIKKYIPNFEELYKEEADKIEKEIELELEKQI